VRDYPLELSRDSDTITTLDPTHLLLAFKESHTFEDISLPLQRLGLALEEGDREETSSFSSKAINHTDRRFWVRALHGGAIDEQLYDSIEQKLDEW
jgi:hypothetical protein